MTWGGQTLSVLCLTSPSVGTCGMGAGQPHTLVLPGEVLPSGVPLLVLCLLHGTVGWGLSVTPLGLVWEAGGGPLLGPPLAASQRGGPVLTLCCGSLAPPHAAAPTSRGLTGSAFPHSLGPGWAKNSLSWWSPAPCCSWVGCWRRSPLCLAPHIGQSPKPHPCPVSMGSGEGGCGAGLRCLGWSATALLTVLLGPGGCAVAAELEGPFLHPCDFPPCPQSLQPGWGGQGHCLGAAPNRLPGDGTGWEPLAGEGPAGEAIGKSCAWCWGGGRPPRLAPEAGGGGRALGAGGQGWEGPRPVAGEQRAGQLAGQCGSSW